MPVLLFEMIGMSGGAFQYLPDSYTPALLVFGNALLNYGLSLVDAWTVADDDFLYPTYAELYLSGGYVSAYAWLLDGDRNLLGIRGKTDIAYFLSLKTGIRASVEYANMKDMDTGSDYKMQRLLASAGIVLRL